MKISVLRFILLLTLMISSNSLAQEVVFPLKLEGSGTTQTTAFRAEEPWKISMVSTHIALVYLYNSVTGEMITTILNEEEVALYGSFFLYINTQGSWQLTISSASENQDQAASDLSDTPIPVSLPLQRFGYGTQRYLRSPDASLNTAACNGFIDVFEAQNAFLEAGGPEHDPQNLDPDGDGYACDYNPREEYTAPRNCGEERVWRNPRYRNADGIYILGRCVEQ